MPGEYYSTEGPKCPYCDHQMTADEGYYYDESRTEMECGDCDKTFNVRVCIETSWTTNTKENNNA